MSIEKTLLTRCDSKCELCGSTNSLAPFAVPPKTDITVDNCVMICETCTAQIEDADKMDVNHLRCLNDSIWSQVPTVQVMSYVLLTKLASESWAQDALDMMYVEEDVKEWAEKALLADGEKPRDINGVELKKGDHVTVTKDLPVKGTNQVIKQGTVIRGISLGDDPRLVSGKANGGQSMYVIAEFCRKK
ncbi:MAG: alkylphosphonate utilization protein [Aliivibrio sp.]|nr:alkylphosphonate utilization protein [Aliivibrio sp.]